MMQLISLTSFILLHSNLFNMILELKEMGTKKKILKKKNRTRNSESIR